MTVIEGLKYTAEHEWIKVEGSKAYIGITDFAQHSLGDIVFVELPEVDMEINQGEELGVVESVKAASNVFMPVSGKVVEINEELASSPEQINRDAYGSWFVAVELSNLEELDSLMDADAYKRICEEEA